MFYVMQRYNFAIVIQRNNVSVGYMPPGYALNEIDTTKMLYNERWWPCNISAIVNGGGGAAAFGKRSNYQCLTREYVESIQNK